MLARPDAMRSKMAGPIILIACSKRNWKVSSDKRDVALKMVFAFSDKIEFPQFLFRNTLRLFRLGQE